jgi:hypothetical protein
MVVDSHVKVISYLPNSKLLSFGSIIYILEHIADKNILKDIPYKIIRDCFSSGFTAVVSQTPFELEFFTKLS